MSVRSVLCSLPASHAGGPHVARRVARRRSLARAQRMRMCVLARRCVRRKEEKSVPAKEEQKFETRKKLRACCKAGIPKSGTVPVDAHRLLRL